MTLKMQLDSLEGLDENISPLYVEKEGKFYLDVDGHEKNDKNKIPRSRLNQEIDKRKAAEIELAALAEDLKKDVPEDKQGLIPDLPGRGAGPRRAESFGQLPENPPVRSGFSRGGAHGPHPVDAAFAVGVGAVFFAPGRRRQNHMGEFRGFVEENILDH